jgi:hypothetical protein
MLPASRQRHMQSTVRTMQATLIGTFLGVECAHATRLSSASMQNAVRGVLYASTDKRRVGLVCAPRRGRASRRRGVGSAQWANSLLCALGRGGSEKRRDTIGGRRRVISNVITLRSGRRHVSPRQPVPITRPIPQDQPPARGSTPSRARAGSVSDRPIRVSREAEAQPQSSQSDSQGLPWALP